MATFTIFDTDKIFFRRNIVFMHMHICVVVDDKVVVYQSDRADDWRGAASVTAWRPRNDEFTELWAPEIHFIRGNLYIYFTANVVADTAHRMFALQADDPANPLGNWTFRGRIFDRRKDIWAIDETVLQHQNGKLYLIWVGGWVSKHSKLPYTDAP